MTDHPMCPAVSGSGLPCALLLHHASPGSEYPHITIEGHLFEEQVKPAIVEPEEFASVVRATSHGESMLWQKTPMHGKHYWESETGVVEVWSELTDVEVLRVGVGDQKIEPLAQWESDLLNQQHRREVAVSVLEAIDVDQYLIDAVANARPL